MYPLHRIKRLGLADIATALPSPLRWDANYHCPGGDIYICALGFEPRCLAISDQMVNEGTRFASCIYLEYLTNQSDNQRTLPRLRDNLNKISDSVEVLNADSDDFLSQLSDLLIKAANGHSKKLDVFLDISGFANRFVISSMRANLAASS